MAAALALSSSADLFRDDIADKSSRVCRNIQTSQSHVKSTIQFIPAWKAEISTKRLRDSFGRYFRVFACCANVAGKDSFENFQNKSDSSDFDRYFDSCKSLKTNLHETRAPEAARLLRMARGKPNRGGGRGGGNDVKSMQS